jgi:dynein heavy chain
MRERHWKELRLEVKADFDETGDDFNLEKLFTLGLMAHQEKIFELVDNAKKQLRIEQDLFKIEDMWDRNPKSNLDVEKTKSKADNEEYYFIRSTDQIMEIIEEHGTLLGSMKSSPYYKEFDTKIDHWEHAIAQITETLEILLQVQSKWKYLESIFKGQPDISKQLPNEDAIFRRNHVQFKDEMERISKDRNCKRALTEKKNFLQDLYELNE